MSLLFYLLLSHFIADFPLQGKGIVDLKHKHFWGILLHTFIHLIVMVVILFPILHIKKVWISILLVFIFHTIVDIIKVYIDNKYPNWHRFFWYIMDQLAHWMTVLLISYYFVGKLSVSFSSNFMSLYYNPSVVIYLLLIVMATYFYDITRWFYRANKGTKKTIISYKRDYRMMLTNFTIITIGFAVYWVCLRFVA